jgi:hypothetical protein
LTSVRRVWNRSGDTSRGSCRPANGIYHRVPIGGLAGRNGQAGPDVQRADARGRPAGGFRGLTLPSRAATLSTGTDPSGGSAARVRDGVTPSEIAFLALGLLLGIAGGAAIVMTTRARPPTHEIRVTLARDAIPRRASTLATDLALGATDGPAPGGPGDRRLVDRAGSDFRTPVRPDGLPVVASPVLPWRTDPAPGVSLEPPLPLLPLVPLEPSVPREPALASADAGEPFRRVAIAIHPERDSLDAWTPSVGSLLDGNHRAMLAVIDSIGGTDDASRTAWDTLLSRFVDAARERAIDLGLLDLPMGNAFWDTFTIEQCRQIVVSLQATGRRFDGQSDWADGLIPSYRDLGRAVADTGLDPRRVRAWPNSLEIGELFRGARVATTEAVEQSAPGLDREGLRAFLADRDQGLDELWPLWDAVRAALDLGVTAPA